MIVLIELLKVDVEMHYHKRELPNLKIFQIECIKELKNLLLLYYIFHCFNFNFICIMYIHNFCREDLLQ